MLFVAIGFLVGPEVLDGIDLTPSSSLVRTAAEATLALVLFADASRIDLRGAAGEAWCAGTAARLRPAAHDRARRARGRVLFDQLTFGEVMILGVILAPTDAALGQAVVSEPRVPARIRQALNVESGLNDGICVPLLFAAVALADAESKISAGRRPVELLLEEIGYGVLGGVAAGALVASHHPGRRRARSDHPALASGRSRRRCRARLRHRERTARIGLHRGLRGGDRLPRCCSVATRPRSTS